MHSFIHSFIHSFTHSHITSPTFQPGSQKDFTKCKPEVIFLRVEVKVPTKACKTLNDLALYPHLLGSLPPHLSHTGLLAVSVPHALVDSCPRVCMCHSLYLELGFLTHLPSPSATLGSNVVTSGNFSLITLFYFVFSIFCPPLFFCIALIVF